MAWVIHVGLRGFDSIRFDSEEKKAHVGLFKHISLSSPEPG